MNKKLMAVAVAGALSAPGIALAQLQTAPGISFYGYIDIAVLSNKFSSTPVTAGGTTPFIGETKKGTVYASNNRIGFRGREDLGGGTAAWFQLEAGIHPDGRSDTAVTTGIDFGGRDSGLGLSNPWGDVMYGIWGSPYKYTTDTTWNLVTSGGFGANGVIMGNGDTTGSSPNANCTSPDISPANGTAQTAQTVCASYVAANSTSFHRRLSQTVQYWSPVMSGFQFKLATQLPSNESDSTVTVGASNNYQKPKLYSGSLNWARGPLLLVAAYEQHTAFRMGTGAGSPDATKDTAWQFGGKWDFGPAQIGAAYEKLSYGDTAGTGQTSTKMDQANMVVDARWSIGPGALWGAYSRTPGGTGCTNPNASGVSPLVIGNASCGNAGKAKEFSIGYDYILSKRSKVYFVFNKIDNGAGTNYYYVAGPQGNASGGTAQGIVAGTDVTTLGVGMQTVF